MDCILHPVLGYDPTNRACEAFYDTLSTSNTRYRKVHTLTLYCGQHPHESLYEYRRYFPVLGSPKLKGIHQDLFLSIDFSTAVRVHSENAKVSSLGAHQKLQSGSSHSPLLNGSDRNLLNANLSAITVRALGVLVPSSWTAS